jgi:lipid A 3-O-deacylase
VTVIRHFPHIAAVCILFCAVSARAQSYLDAPQVPAKSGDQWRLTLFWENDSTFLKPNSPADRHYTNGVGLAYAVRGVGESLLGSTIPGAEGFGPTRTAFGFTAGQLMYTPEDITATGVLVNDRPYAGYLYGGLYLQRSNDRVLEHFQIDLGVVGPNSLAEDAQSAVHELMNGVDPKGWDNQLNDEATFQYYYRRKWRSAKHPTTGGSDWQTIPQMGVALGTVHRYLEGGVMVRIGQNLPDDFGPGHLQDVPAATGDDVDGWGWFSFLHGGVRLVEHNMLLEGNNFSESHGVDAEPIVGLLRLGVGVVWHEWDSQLEFVYSQTFMTEEFVGQAEPDSYGQVLLSITQRF